MDTVANMEILCHKGHKGFVVFVSLVAHNI